MPLKFAGWLTAGKQCRVHILPNADERENFTGAEAASVTDGVTSAAWTGEFPPEVVYFGEIWVSPAGELVPLVVRMAKSS